MAASIGSGEDRSWLTWTRRATRSNSNDRTPANGFSAERISFSSVAQSNFSTQYVDTPGAATAPRNDLPTTAGPQQSSASETVAPWCRWACSAFGVAE